MNVPAIDDLPSARGLIAHFHQRMKAAGIADFREPPPEPDTCCGRGCNGCVWESYYAAVGWWCEDVQEAIEARG